MEIEIGGATQGVGYDYIEATEDIVLSGSRLQLSLITGFVPSPTTTFTILKALDVLAGEFANVANRQRLTTSDGGGSFLVSYGSGSPNPNQIVISEFLPHLNGDFDLDGDVDGADFLVWQRGGSPNPNSASDLAEWRGNFGFHELTPSGSAAPEPRAGWLALSLTLSIWHFQRKPRCLGRID
jgi:hypothetical protein